MLVKNMKSITVAWKNILKLVKLQSLAAEEGKYTLAKLANFVYNIYFCTISNTKLMCRCEGSVLSNISQPNFAVFLILLTSFYVYHLLYNSRNKINLELKLSIE